MNVRNKHIPVKLALIHSLLNESHVIVYCAVVRKKWRDHVHEVSPNLWRVFSVGNSGCRIIQSETRSVEEEVFCLSLCSR